MTQDRWKRLAKLADQPPSRFAISAGVEVEVTETTFMLRLATTTASADEAVRSEPVPLPVPGQADWEGIPISSSLVEIAGYDEMIDLDKVVLPLTIRGPEPGDRFEPLGLEGQGMALNDFFRGRSVARADRRKIPLVCDQAGILWVVGHRISHRARLTTGTTRRLWLRSGCD